MKLKAVMDDQLKHSHTDNRGHTERRWFNWVSILNSLSCQLFSCRVVPLFCSHIWLFLINKCRNYWCFLWRRKEWVDMLYLSVSYRHQLYSLILYVGSWQTCWYLWMYPENKSHFTVSQEPAYPSDRWGPDLKGVPAGRRFNELICIAPVSLSTAIIITHTLSWKPGHPIAQLWQPQKDSGTLFLLLMRSNISNLFFLYVN